jgi:hypothetical protein
MRKGNKGANEEREEKEKMCHFSTEVEIGKKR